VRARPGRALADGLPERERIDSGLDAERHDLREHRLQREAGRVVDELRDRAGADRADVERLVADCLQKRQVPVVDRLLAANPERELSRLRTARSAADRRVEQVDVARSERRVKPAHDIGRVGRQVEPDQARAQRTAQALRQPLRHRQGPEER
jgi:hypothetical protein